MGDVYNSRSWSPWSSTVVERGEPSLSRKRPGSSARGWTPPPPPRRTPQRDYSGYNRDYDIFSITNNGSHRPRSSPERWTPTMPRRTPPRLDDDHQEDQQQSRSQEERGSSSRDHESSAGYSGADGVAGGGVAEEQPAAEVVEGSDDNDRPISAVSRPRTLLHGGSTCTAPPESTAPAPPEPSPPSSSCSDSSRNVTVENFSAFDCTICYHPLKSPIFQCTVGHVVCSPCHDKLQHATTCHVCRVPIPGGYSRCITMEQVVDSIRLPCPHAAHGCDQRLAYHDHDDHSRTCEHKPCHCPADGCGFVGSVQTTLLEHFAAVHGWPCSAGSTGDNGFDVSLRTGFNIVTVMDDLEHEQYTLVLNLEQEAPVWTSITAFCIHPCHTGIVKLGLSYCRRWGGDSTVPSKYVQSSQLDVVCTDLANGKPGPSSCIPLPVPRWSAALGGDDIDDISVTVNSIRRYMPASIFFL